jgi:ABC-2 type transport system ATP-binding protein
VVPSQARQTALSARGLTKRYGRRAALRDVSLILRAGELAAIIGPNGAGKTTLLSLLAGVSVPDAGELDPSCGPVGWVPQRPAVYAKLSVEENLLLFARLERVADPHGVVERMLTQTALGERRQEPVGRLSGGNQQRVNIAIGLLSEPPVLLLDEPSASLDPRQRERLWEFVATLTADGTSVLYSTHDIFEVERHAERVLVLDEGELCFTGTPAQLERAVGGQSVGMEAAFLRFLAARERGPAAAPSRR